MSSRYLAILREVLILPTAPFAEHAVVEYIRGFCRRRSLSVRQDSVGNILVHLRRGRRRIPRPVCLTAHLDHPGFVSSGMSEPRILRAHWRGGVSPGYFAGTQVRFFHNDAWVRGTIRRIQTVRLEGIERVRTAWIEVPRAIPSGTIGMWDLPDPVIRGSRIFARACDDLAGAAAMLCCMDELTRSGSSCDAYFLFTRAEEVGFIGALAAARLKTIPARCLVVSMETSSQRPNALPGEGPILRVGDKTTTFTPAATAYCRAIADDVAKRDSTFRYQRRLMDGGTCESSAFCSRGYEATGLCVALGNYHNMDASRKKIAPEFIDLDDFRNVVSWFLALAHPRIPYTSVDAPFDRRLTALERQYASLLARTVSRPA
jgi:putative aminopeptidase FrvX